jgi:hypothetical protein
LVDDLNERSDAGDPKTRPEKTVIGMRWSSPHEHRCGEPVSLLPILNLLGLFILFFEKNTFLLFL